MTLGRNHRTHCYEIPTVFVALAVARRERDRQVDAYFRAVLGIEERELLRELRRAAWRVWAIDLFRRAWRTLNDIRSFTLTTGGR